MLAYIGEFIGTMLLILIGESAGAGLSLNRSGMKGSNTVHITIAWGLAVMIPAFIFGKASGAHFNPALTLALALDGSIPWQMVPGYFIAQFSGAFLGACLMYLLYKDHFDATKDSEVIKGVFFTSPSIDHRPLNYLSEIIETFILVFAIKGLSQVEGLTGGINNLLVFGIIVSIGMSFGGLTGYALNPARDWGPRLAHTILPIKHKGSSCWNYALVPLLGPIVGALLAVSVYAIIPWA